jgi:hypothetical protein
VFLSPDKVQCSLKMADREHEQDYNPTEWIIKAIRDQDKEDDDGKA